MIQKSFCLLTFIYLVSTGFAFGQTDNMAKLLQERDELYKAYDHYNQQNSSLFGKKSKKDLVNIINTLKGIINKDTEIIREVRLQSSQARLQTTQKESSYVNSNRQIVERVNSLNSDIHKLTAQVKLKQSELQTQRDMYEAQSKNLTLFKILAAILAILALGLAWYARKLKLAVTHK